MPRGDYIEKLQQVIGTPEENRDLLVRAILLDKKMTCESCNLTYQTGADMEQLGVRLGGAANHLTEPVLIVELTCHCGHTGRTLLIPNPLVIT